MHGLADGIVAAEGEGEVGDAARGIAAGQVALDPADGFYEINSVAGVFGHAGSHGKNVAVKDNVAGFYPRLSEQLVAAGADFYLALQGGGLSLFIEGHYHHGGSQALDFQGLFQEYPGTLLERDGVHDAFALGVLEAGEHRLPVGGVNHERRPGHGRVSGNIPQEGFHLPGRIQHGVVHVDVNDAGAAFYLLCGHLQGFLVLPGGN